MRRRPLVMGVDGGGTKTLGLISDQSVNILAHREVGATNPNVVGVASAAKSLARLVSRCCEDAGCRPDDLGAIVLGLAGVGSNDAKSRLQNALLKQLHRTGGKQFPAVFETDARVGLEGAFNGGPGVVIIAGTGSVVIGKDQDGAIVRIGGWGRILGDEGSGYSIGVEAIKAVTHHFDGRGEASTLANVFGERFGWTTRDAILSAIYQEKFDVPSLAPLVLAAAAGHDNVSLKILHSSATHLVDQARAVVMRMGIVRKVALAFMGGLIDHDSVYANILEMKIRKLLPQVDLRPATHSPAHGAVLMALEQLGRFRR